MLFYLRDACLECDLIVYTGNEQKSYLKNPRMWCARTY